MIGLQSRLFTKANNLLKGEDGMENILRNAVEQRRKTLINILLTLKISDSEEQLSKLSLTELENELKRLRSNSHPHSDTGSIIWKN
jgi:predicted CopG family antitoxin